MAIIDSRELPTVRHGVTLGLYPSSDSSYDVSLERSVGSSASTGFSQIARLNPFEGQSSLLYTDMLPNDNIYRYYRARHVKPGYTNGSYTTIARAKPVLVVASQSLPNVELSGLPLGQDIHLTTGNTVRFGFAGTTGSYLRKNYMFGAAEFNPITSTYNSYRLNQGYLQPDTQGGTASTKIQQFRISLGLPVGAVIRGAKVRVYVTSTVGAGSVLCTLRRYSSATSTSVDIGTNGFGISSGSTLAAATWHTVSSTAFTHVVSSEFTNYDMSILMKAGTPTQRVPRFQWALLEVDVPSLDIAR